MRPLARPQSVAALGEAPMNGGPRPSLDEFLFGVSYSGAASAPKSAALPYHRVSRGVSCLPLLQHYLICVADSVSTNT